MIPKKAETGMAQHAPQRLSENAGFLLANLTSQETGVEGAVIWVSAGEFEDGDPHGGPRLMVVVGDSIKSEGLREAVTVLLTSPPEVLGTLPDKLAEQVVMFAAKNREVLLRYWNGEIYTKEMLDGLESV